MPQRSWLRSLAKTLSWRLFATVDTFVVSIIVTKNLKWAGSIIGIEIVTKMSWYLLHERAWARLPLGLKPGIGASTDASPPRTAFGGLGARCLAVHVHAASGTGALHGTRRAQRR